MDSYYAITKSKLTYHVPYRKICGYDLFCKISHFNIRYKFKALKNYSKLQVYV